MKLEIGMFIRYKGKIGKYKGYTGNDRGELYTYDFTTFEVDSDDEENKIVELYNLMVSKNLIDLIEVGDYVNGVGIEMIENGNTEFGFDEGRELFKKYFNYNPIKSILTHEQYEANCYKVGE